MFMETLLTHMCQVYYCMLPHSDIQDLFQQNLHTHSHPHCTANPEKTENIISSTHKTKLLVPIFINFN